MVATASDGAAFGQLLAAVEPVAGPFAAAGFQLHLVGGSVRDALLDRSGDGDLDLTTDARPDETLALLRTLTDTVWTQGERFGTIGAQVDGRPYEITTHRTERYDTGSRKPHVEFADALEEDLARRDFTVNAMAVAVPSGELVDPYGGRDDLVSQVLRTPLSPEISFVDDPLRMLRAGRFIARFGLTPVDDLVAAAVEHAARLEIVSVERVLDELAKLLETQRPMAGLRFLARTGLLARVLPEADVDIDIDELPAERSLRLAALLSSAPPRTATLRLGRLRASRELTDAVGFLVGAVAAIPDDPDAEAVRRWVARGSGWRAALLLASTIDPLRARSMSAAIDALGSTEDLDDQSLPVDGGDIMRELGVPSGPEVGAALAELREHRFRVGPLSRAAALEHLRRDR